QGDPGSGARGSLHLVRVRVTTRAGVRTLWLSAARELLPWSRWRADRARDEEEATARDRGAGRGRPPSSATAGGGQAARGTKEGVGASPRLGTRDARSGHAGAPTSPATRRPITAARCPRSGIPGRR